MKRRGDADGRFCFCCRLRREKEGGWKKTFLLTLLKNNEKSRLSVKNKRLFVSNRKRSLTRIMTILKRCVARISGERYHVADVPHPGYKLNHSLKPKSVSAVWTGSILPYIKVPVQFLYRYIHFFHPIDHFFVICFPLGTTDDLSDSGKKNIHRFYSFAVFAALHVKCFTILAIVRSYHRTLEMFFDPLSFVL